MKNHILAYSFLFIIFFMINPGQVSANPDDQPQIKRSAVDGAIDLSGFTAKERGFKLKGQWKFVHSQLLTPEQIATQNPETVMDVMVPEDNFVKLGFTGKGWGTFFLHLDNIDPNDKDLGLRVGQFATNGQVYWAGMKEGKTLFSEKIATVGVVTTKDEEWRSEWKTVIAKLRTSPEADRYMLVFQHSNFLGNAGFLEPFRFGHYSDLIASDTLNLWQTFLVLGMLFMIVVYNFSLFSQRRDDLGSLFIALYALLMGTRYVFTEGLPARFFEEPSLFMMEAGFWSLSGAFPIGMALFINFLKHSFKGCYSSLMVRGIWGYSILLILAQGFISMEKMQEWSVLTVVAIPLFGFGSYAIFGLIKAARRKMRGALLSMLGMFILVYGFIHDSAVYMQDLPIPFIAHYCLVAFTFIQSTITGINFAFAFRTADRLSRELALEVERQTRDIKSILTNIHQGIFTVQRQENHYVVGPDYSRFLGEILETKEISDKSVEQLILNESDLSREIKDMVRSTLDFVVGEPAFAFEMNEECLPKGFNLQMPGQDRSKIIKAEWSPIINEKTDITEKVLVSLRDVTELTALEEKSKAHQKEITIISEIVHLGIEKFGLFCRSARQFIEENKRLIDAMAEPDEEVLKVLFINMHTVKGAARTYALTPITEVVHNAEQYYAALQRKEEEFNHQQLKDDIIEVESIFAEYETVFHEKLGMDENANTVEVNLDSLKISVEALQALESQVSMDNQATNHFSSIRDTLYDLYFLKADKLFNDAFSNLERLAKDLGKPTPEVNIDLESYYLTHETGKILGDCFTHILRNSMDHGIEDEDTRKSKNKPPAGTMSLVAKHFEDYSVLEFSDDGAGLNLDRIKKRGLENNIITENDNLKPQEIAELIFHPGFSTAQTVSQISGRGVGMDAIRTYLKEINGEVHITLLQKTQQEGIPFALCITIPQPFCKYLGTVKQEAA